MHWDLMESSMQYANGFALMSLHLPAATLRSSNFDDPASCSLPARHTAGCSTEPGEIRGRTPLFSASIASMAALALHCRSRRRRYNQFAFRRRGLWLHLRIHCRAVPEGARTAVLEADAGQPDMIDLPKEVPQGYAELLAPVLPDDFSWSEFVEASRRPIRPCIRVNSLKATSDSVRQYASSNYWGYAQPVPWTEGIAAAAGNAFWIERYKRPPKHALPRFGK